MSRVQTVHFYVIPGDYSAHSQGNGADYIYTHDTAHSGRGDILELGGQNLHFHPPVFVFKRPVLVLVDSNDGLLATYTQRGLSLLTDDPTANVMCKEIVNANDRVAILIMAKNLSLLKQNTVIKGLTSQNVDTLLSTVAAAQATQSPWLILSKPESLLVDPSVLDQVYVRVQHHELEPWDLPAYAFPGTSAGIDEITPSSEFYPAPAPILPMLCVSPEKPRPFPVLFAPSSSPLAALRPPPALDLSDLTPAVSITLPSSQHGLTAIVSVNSPPAPSTHPAPISSSLSESSSTSLSASGSSAANAALPVSAPPAIPSVSSSTSSSSATAAATNAQDLPAPPAISAAPVSSAASSSSEAHASSESTVSSSVPAHAPSAALSQSSASAAATSSASVHKPQDILPSPPGEPLVSNGHVYPQTQSSSVSSVPLFVPATDSSSSDSKHSSSSLTGSQAASLQSSLLEGQNNAASSGFNPLAASSVSSANQGFSAPAAPQLPQASPGSSSITSTSASSAANYQFLNNPNIMPHTVQQNLLSSSPPAFHEQNSGSIFSSSRRPVTAPASSQHSLFNSAATSASSSSLSLGNENQGSFQIAGKFPDFQLPHSAILSQSSGNAESKNVASSSASSATSAVSNSETKTSTNAASSASSSASTFESTSASNKVKSSDSRSSVFSRDSSKTNRLPQLSTSALTSTLLSKDDKTKTE